MLPNQVSNYLKTKIFKIKTIVTGNNIFVVSFCCNDNPAYQPYHSRVKKNRQLMLTPRTHESLKLLKKLGYFDASKHLSFDKQTGITKLVSKALTIY